MTTPHPHLDPIEALRRLRALGAEYEAGSTRLNTVDQIIDEFRALDRWLCNGGALPGDWIPDDVMQAARRITTSAKRAATVDNPHPGYQAVYNEQGAFVSWDPDGTAPREALPPWPAAQPVAQPMGGGKPTHFKIEKRLEDAPHFRIHYYNRAGVYLYTHYDQVPPGWSSADLAFAPRGVALILAQKEPPSDSSFHFPGVSVQPGQEYLVTVTVSVKGDKITLMGMEVSPASLARPGDTVPQPGNPAHSPEESPTG